MFNINIRATLIEGVRAMCMNVWNLNAAPRRGWLACRDRESEDRIRIRGWCALRSVVMRERVRA